MSRHGLKPLLRPWLLVCLVLPAVLMAALPAISLAAPTARADDDAIVTHRLQARLVPETGHISVTDILTLPADVGQVVFWLHEGLRPEVISGNAVLERIGHTGHLERFRLSRKGSDPVSLRYAGSIRHPMQTVREGMGRSRMQSIGTIEPDGVYLNGYSGWYPRIDDTLLRFTLDLCLPPGWLAVSQGAGPVLNGNAGEACMQWQEALPQDQIHLSAGRFKLYRRPTAHGEAQVYLRLPDDALAARYLDATATYLDRYSGLIGPYPYAKFALVENFWETGYGMPSFTLLGSRVLRLPFILHTSYPHEILHNWWGNSVYIDYASGNWSEGLTAYLADHLNQELDGRGADYRRDQLKAYADYVDGDADFPLTAFRGRHGTASQAVGYGKMLMTTHMLRTLLGDETFRAGLQRFYADNRFRVASLDDLQQAFESVSNRDLQPFFDAWTRRTGAAELSLVEVQSRPRPDGSHQVSGRIEQTQPGPALPMAVPVVAHADGGQVEVSTVELDDGQGTFTLDLPSAPVRVAVDPRFETFRRLSAAESPVALSNLFGADGGLILLPAAAPAALRDGYLALARAWLQGRTGWTTALDTELQALPTDRPVWLLGWENRFLPELAAANPAIALNPPQRQVVLAGETLGTSAQQDANGAASLVLTAWRDRQALGWVATSTPEALPGLARKLPHYGKYGYLAFRGKAPDIQRKGQWPTNDSPLMHWFTNARPALPLPPREPVWQP
ncbi:M1 family peptidase [Thiohalocapsa marina]|uniref:M1 family peptidase n=1 Tax=Thiohalocapsa marina TaxID=424902 RepID=A0A5M8FT44_9GAMM|nr:M1 family aminopeptidase [Thiohalocapsa marina]KAA6186970.1 M1 family peptidase [Thiohalocapsa marina]